MDLAILCDESHTQCLFQKQTDYDDAATAVDLVKVPAGPICVGSGWFWSDSQMLVSNEIDDKHDAATYLGADESGPGAYALPKNDHTWKVSDRTHRIALRGTVKASYEIAGQEAKSVERIARVTKNVKVHITILKNGGVEVISKENAELAVHKANEQYAQVGIRIIPSVGQLVEPIGVNLADNFTATEWLLDKNSKVILSYEETVLLEATDYRTVSTDDVELYFVNRFENNDQLGEAFSGSAVDAKYADSAIISVDLPSSLQLVIAHEVGHLLLNPSDHDTSMCKFANLMYAYNSADVPTGAKRLTASQQVDMLSKRPGLLTGP